MKPIVVRATRPSDLPRISDLTAAVFGVRRRTELLAWLLANPHAPEQVDSWVAECDGEVVGHTGVLKCRYRMDGHCVTGAHAFLWMVDGDARGVTGLKLGTQIVTAGDFVVVVGGSPTTKAILAGRRFSRPAEAVEYAFRDETVRRASRREGGYELRPRSSFIDSPVASSVRSPDVVGNEAPPEHLEWLAGCPDLEAHRFTLERGGDGLGPVLLFVNRASSPVAGRLVHLPYLGEAPEDWLATLAAVSRELARLGCHTWTALSTHPKLTAACETARGEIMGRRPIWIKPRRELGLAGPWHLTYVEGDLAYRRVESPTVAPPARTAARGAETATAPPPGN